MTLVWKDAEFGRRWKIREGKKTNKKGTGSTEKGYEGDRRRRMVDRRKLRRSIEEGRRIDRRR